MNEIYYQRQSGGLCRLHSLNAYFGKEQISIPQFEIYKKEYDVYYKQKFNIESSCSNFDIVNSDQTNIVSYILKKHNVYTKYYALNEIQTQSQKDINKYIISILNGDFFFIYTETHIYGARNYKNKWYNVDSISGVRPMNINGLLHTKNIGFIVPVHIKDEYLKNITLIKVTIAPVGGEITYNDIKEFLVKKHKDKDVLGELEIPLSLCIDILETNMKHKHVFEFQPIQNQIKKYNEFLAKFSKGKCNDIDLILRYLPDIIIQLLPGTKKK